MFKKQSSRQKNNNNNNNNSKKNNRNAITQLLRVKIRLEAKRQDNSKDNAPNAFFMSKEYLMMMMEKETEN